MAAARSFTELLFWQKARQWSKAIFVETKSAPFRSDQRLVVQINDSSESVMANMAEGFGRGTQAEFVLFLGYALGSLDETCSHLVAAYDREFLTKSRYAALFRQGIEIRKLTVSFIRSMILPRGGVRTAAKRPSWSSEVWELYERVTGQPRPERFVEKRDEDETRPPSNDAPPT